MNKRSRRNTCAIFQIVVQAYSSRGWSDHNGEYERQPILMNRQTLSSRRLTETAMSASGTSHDFSDMIYEFKYFVYHKQTGKFN